MKDLILYPDAEEKIKINYKIDYKRQLFLPEGSSTEKLGENVYNLGVESVDLKDVDFQKGTPEFDKTNYRIAAAVGILSGTLNVLWSKDYDLVNAQEWGREKTEKFVIKVAKSQGYRGNDIKGAINKLETKFEIQADKYTKDFGEGKQHHLRDFSHHPSILGLLCSILNQFGIGIGTDKSDNLKILNAEELGLDRSLEGKTFGEKIFNGTIKWVFHLISDVAGSSSMPGYGAGIPGPILAIIKEFSSLPIFKKNKDEIKEFSQFISKLYNGTYFKDKDGKPIKIDFRTEIGVLANQSKSVLVNECIIRAVYSIRALYKEIKTKEIKSLKDLNKIEAKEVLPIKSKMLTRMMTISTGIFVLIDLGKATIKSNGLTDIKSFVLSLNYVGIARFAVSCALDAVYMEEDFNEYLYEKYYNLDELIVKFNILNLNKEQENVLKLLEIKKVEYDIKYCKDEEEKKKKTEWLEQWKIITETKNVPKEHEIYDKLERVCKDNDAFIIIAIELYLFKPYIKLEETKEKVKNYKMHKNYYKEVFVKKQNCVDEKELKEIINIFNNYKDNILQERNKRLLIGAGASVGVAAITGGLGLAFAPEIAALIAGESVAGLSGAALSSASLAYVGGGALVAGGLGMAGGTAILTGGGALVGLAESGVTSIASVFISMSNFNILERCSEFLTYSKLALIKKNNDKKSIDIEIKNIDKLVENYERKLKTEEFLKNKDAIKGVKLNIKYLTRTSKVLKDMIK